MGRGRQPPLRLAIEDTTGRFALQRRSSYLEPSLRLTPGPRRETEIRTSQGAPES